MLHCSKCVPPRLCSLYHTIWPSSPPLAPLHNLLSHRAPIGVHAAFGRRQYATELRQAGHPQLPFPIRYTDPNDRTSTGERNVVVEQQPSKELSPLSQLELEKELKWVEDPLKMANKTKTYLEKKNETEFQKAAALVRHASKKMLCTVSWNHLINHRMQQGNVTSALRLFNDMKKRAQAPDAFTYTTLFTGLARNSKYSLSSQRALAIYQSMFAENSPVKPNLTHTNAVLNVCALCGDIDAMLGVAAKLPQRGKGAPDKITYSTILNAIRSQATDKINHYQAYDTDEVKKQAARQGSRLWDEIRARWSKGELDLDEDLVFAIGRLLLMTPQPLSLYDILVLLDQTMRIPQQALPPEEKLALLEGPEGADPKPLELQRTKHGQADLGKLLPTQYYVRPGNKTLSLVLQTCTELRLYQAAQDYWGLLTARETFDVEPDKQNYLDYLRLLRFQRQSRMTVELIREMKDSLLQKEDLEPKFFRIALSTCLRDVKNPKSLKYAEQLVKLMDDTLETPDPKTLESYMTLAISQDGRSWSDVFSIARSLIVPVRLLRSEIVDLYAKNKKLSRPEEHGAVVRRENDTLSLARKMISAFEIAMNEGRESMSREQQKMCKANKIWLSVWMHRRGDYKKAERDGKIDADREKARFLHEERLAAVERPAQFIGASNDGKLVRSFPLKRDEEDSKRKYDLSGDDGL